MALRIGQYAKLALVGIVMILASQICCVEKSFAAISEIPADFAPNNILFYNPLAGSCTTTSNSVVKSYNDIVITGDTMNERLADVTRKYGGVAMDLQKEWGTPWEVVFAQMQVESAVGMSENGVNAGVAQNGYYNWLGIRGDGGKFSVGTPYYTSNGWNWAQYESIENMMKDWAGEYIARNGQYDEAFKYLDPNNYDMRSFLDEFIRTYLCGSDPECKAEQTDSALEYITSVMNMLEGTIKTVREEEGWLSSEDFAKKNNIGIGGQHPISGENSSGGSSDENADDSSGSSSESSGGSCGKLTSSPDYDSSGYQGRLKNLHDFSQSSGYFSAQKICGYDIYDTACGVMSAYAAYYMFSGQGWNDQTVFDEFTKAATGDGYYSCDAGEVAYLNYNANGNLTPFTQMSGNLLYSEDIYSGDHWDVLVAELQKGNKVIINTTVNGFPSLFTGNGHFMLLDHYNASKDMIYVFDPSMYDGKLLNVISVAGVGSVEYGSDSRDGFYINRKGMDTTVGPRYALSLSYDGCWDGGTSSNVCRNVSDGGSGLKEGGMSYDEAVSFMAKYRNEASKKLRGDYGKGQQNGDVIGDGLVYDVKSSDPCPDGTLNNCSAFTQWFVNNYTTVGPNFGSTSGSKYVDLLIESGGFEDGGQVPQVYAVFSTGCGDEAGDACISPTTGKSYRNHTGVILGIDEEKGLVYTGEAGCTVGFNDEWPGVFTYTIEEMTNTGENGYKFAYPGGKIKLGGSALTEQEAEKMFNTMSVPTYDEVAKVAEQNYGIKGDDFVAVMGWVQNEGYWADWAMDVGSNPYLAYLSACAIINHIVEASDYKTGDLLKEIAAYPAVGGGVYGEALVRDKDKESRTTDGALKAAYMAFTHLQTGIQTCSGWYDGTSKILYGPKTVNGETVYVW